MELLGRIASSLAGRGYQPSRVKPAIGIEAGFYVLLNRFLLIDVLLGISKDRSGRLNCDLCARAWRPFLSIFSFAKRPTESDSVEQLQRLLLALDDEIVNGLGATSVSWITEHELNNLPEPGLGNPESN
jgi:hypothetical protein